MKHLECIIKVAYISGYRNYKIYISSQFTTEFNSVVIMLLQI